MPIHSSTSAPQLPPLNDHKQATPNPPSLSSSPSFSSPSSTSTSNHHANPNLGFENHASMHTVNLSTCLAAAGSFISKVPTLSTHTHLKEPAQQRLQTPFEWVEKPQSEKQGDEDDKAIADHINFSDDFIALADDELDQATWDALELQVVDAEEADAEKKATFEALMAPSRGEKLLATAQSGLSSTHRALHTVGSRASNFLDNQLGQPLYNTAETFQAHLQSPESRAFQQSAVASVKQAGKLAAAGAVHAGAETAGLLHALLQESFKSESNRDAPPPSNHIDREESDEALNMLNIEEIGTELVDMSKKH